MVDSSSKKSLHDLGRMAAFCGVKNNEIAPNLITSILFAMVLSVAQSRRGRSSAGSLIMALRAPLLKAVESVDQE